MTTQIRSDVREMTWTTAPEMYDAFQTHTCYIAGITGLGSPVRCVYTPCEHVDQQRQRYASAIYMSVDQKKWLELAEHKFVTRSDEDRDER